jgi:hypothetical protein
MLDEKKYLMEKLNLDKTKYKAKLEKIMLECETKQKEMIKSLSDRLRLSEKFVRTSQF